MDFKKITKLLRKNGWYEVRVCGSHHQFKNDTFSGTATVPYHPGKTIHLNVIKSLEKQTGLSFPR